ncbi:MAG: hypothetical protein MK180_02945 [Rhodobacteraceae bacterium]|nr:hypothetical protein [Paracoccaceae bacterium]
MKRALILCCFLAACDGIDFELVDGPLPENAASIAAAPEPEVEEEAAEPSESAQDAEAIPPRGLLGRLIARRAERAQALAEVDLAVEEAVAGDEAAAPPEAPDETVEEAAPDVEPVTEEAPQEKVEAQATRPQRAGFFSSLLNRRASRGETIVAPGTDLGYGVVVSSCGTPRSELGKEVSRFPERGSAYRLYDTNPSSTVLRPHYITGFRDGCPRRFVAALAIFGGVQAYETTRYEDGGNTTTVTETDRLYKQIRRRVCGVPVGTECPERRFEKLGRDAVFVSVYERFGTAPTWADMLIYDGEVAAKDFKSIR